VETLNAMLQASADVRDARTASAAKLAVDQEGRPVVERAAALSALLTYLRPELVGRVVEQGGLVFVQPVAQSHHTYVEGEQKFDEVRRSDIAQLFSRLANSPMRELREIAAFAPVHREKK
jgi:hypothetical protein